MLVNPSAFFSCERNQQCIAQRNLGSFPAGKKIKSLLNSKETLSTKRNVNIKEEGNIMEDQQKELMDNWDNCKSIRLNIDGFGDIDVSLNSDEVYFGNLPLQFIYPYVYKIDLKKGYLSNYKNIKPGFWVEMQDDKQYCCGEIEKIEGDTITIACNIAPLKDKENLRGFYKERREKALKKGEQNDLLH